MGCGPVGGSPIHAVSWVPRVAVRVIVFNASLVSIKCSGLNAPYVSDSETSIIFASACQIKTSDICHDHSIDVKTRSLRSSDMMNLEVKEYVRRG